MFLSIVTCSHSPNLMQPMCNHKFTIILMEALWYHYGSTMGAPNTSQTFFFQKTFYLQGFPGIRSINKEHLFVTYKKGG